MIVFEKKGNFENTEKYFKKLSNREMYKTLAKFGEMGTAALASNTPLDSGLTASSWSYEISMTKRDVRISWKNTNEINGVNIAVILQYGHGTGNGGYVEGRDYINPAIQPIFDKIMADIRTAVTTI